MNVLVLHFLTVFWLPPYPGHDRWMELRKVLESTPLSLLWAGDQAVLLFFGLSGFALYSMLDTQRLTLRGYYIRRFFRLWVPYTFSIVLGLLAVALVEPRVFRASIWLNPNVPNVISGQEVAQHLLMVGQFNTFKINGVVWSLVHEMRMSIAFPLLYWGLRRHQWAPVFALSVALAALAAQFERPAYVPTELSSWWRTLYYQVYFVMGAALARHAPAVRRIYGRIPEYGKWAVAVIALVLYSNMLHVVGKASIFAGAALVMVMALSSTRARVFLATPSLQVLGRISFSLYLLHRLVLITTANLAYPGWSLAVITAVAFPLALLAAYLSHRFVEVPANLLGRSLARYSQGQAPSRT